MTDDARNEATDVPLAKCQSCGAEVLEPYVDSEGCLHCRDDRASSCAED